VYVEDLQQKCCNERKKKMKEKREKEKGKNYAGEGRKQRTVAVFWDVMPCSLLGRYDV
jgi:hypothetical protein